MPPCGRLIRTRKMDGPRIKVLLRISLHGFGHTAGAHHQETRLGISLRHLPKHLHGDVRPLEPVVLGNEQDYVIIWRPAQSRPNIKCCLLLNRVRSFSEKMWCIYRVGDKKQRRLHRASIQKNLSAIVAAVMMCVEQPKQESPQRAHQSAFYRSSWIKIVVQGAAMNLRLPSPPVTKNDPRCTRPTIAID